MQLLRDLVSFLAVQVALAPTTITTVGNTDGNLLDRGTSQSQTFVVNATMTNATVTLVVLEGDADDGSDLAPVAESDLILLEGTDTTLTANGCLIAGYKGAKKYLKARIAFTDEGASQTADVSVVMLQASNHLVGGT